MTTPQDNPFRRPEASAGDKWDIKNEGQKWLGSLFLFYPKEIKREFDTGKYKPTDVVVCDVIAVSGPDAGKAWIDTFIFSKGIAAILKDKVGDPVPGVLGQKQFTEGIGWTLLDAQSDAEWDAMCQAVAPVHQRYMQGQFARVDAPAAAGAAAVAQNPPAGSWQQDAWAGLNAAPAAATPAPQGYPAPTAAPPAAAPAAGWNQSAPPAAPPPAAPAAAPAANPPSAGGQQDPNVGLLISKGLDPQQVLAMDPATRAAIAATY